MSRIGDMGHDRESGGVWTEVTEVTSYVYLLTSGESVGSSGETFDAEN